MTLKKLVFGFFLFSVSGVVLSANIFVVDKGLYPEYRDQLEHEGRLLRESCYSTPGTTKRRVATDVNNSQFSYIWEYRYASLCQNDREEDHGANTSTLRTDGLPGAEGRAGHADVPAPVVTDSHQNIIAKIITDNTSSSVKQWHTHTEVLFGDITDAGVQWTPYSALTQESIIPYQVKALQEIGSPFVGYQGVKVVSISSVVPGSQSSEDRYTTPCDNHADLDVSPLKEYAEQITRLRNNGVLTVVATDNTQGDQHLDNYKMPFPACLSTTVSVGGLDPLGEAQGAIGPHTDFLAPYQGRDPITSGLGSGTSYATPKVASYATELITINPIKTTTQVLNVLRDTADTHFGSRQYGSTTINYRIQVPNFQRAKESIVHFVWNELIQLSIGRKNDGFYGWNYGSSNHKNGILSYFDAVTVPSNKAVALQKLNTGDNALRFSFRPYDVDTSDELEILVNDKHYGYVDTTGSGVLGSTQTVCVDPSDLTSDGSDNEIKLKLKTSEETWGVRDLKVEQGVVDSSCKTAPTTTTPDPTNEEVTLTLDSLNTNKYGKNYGRNKSDSFLDVKFTPLADRHHKLSWRLYDIESGEMEIYLNGTRLKNALTTLSNQLGSTDSITIPAGDLLSGVNTLSFKVSGGDGTWGVTNLLAVSIDVPDDGEASSVTLLDKPGGRGFSYSQTYHGFGFTFEPRGQYYRETATISFNAHMLGGTSNGFYVYLNDQRVLTVPRYSRGVTHSKTHSVTVDKSRLRTGNNVLKISVLGRSYANNETSISNIKVVVNSTPFFDTTVGSVSVEGKIMPRKSFDAIASVINLGAATSPVNTLSFYVSNNSNRTGGVLVGRQTISSMVGGSSVSIAQSIDSSNVTDGQYLWACVNHASGDISSGNNCSSVVQLEVSKITITPILQLLLDD